MEKEYRIVGKHGKLSFDRPAEDPHWLPMRFLEYEKDPQGNVCGGRYLIDLGHGYGFNHGEETVTIALDEEISFEHEYTDTSDGTWENESCSVTVRFVAK